MENINLLEEQYYELAILLRNTNVIEITFTPMEMKLLFDLDDEPGKLSQFVWNLNAAFVRGRKDDQEIIFTPTAIMEKLGQLRVLDQIASMLKRYGLRLGSFDLLNKLQQRLDQEFEYLSLGQAKSVIKRHLQLPLSSAERNDISRIRKKLDGYKKMIEAFEGALTKDRDDTIEKIIVSRQRQSEEEFIQGLENQLRFYCYKCNQFLAFPEMQYQVTPPVHHGRVMGLSWNARLNVEESNQGIQELKEAISQSDYLEVAPEPKNISLQPQPQLYCSVCEQRFAIPADLWKQINSTNGRIELPKHHDQEMEIRIHNEDVLGMTKAIGSFLKNINKDDIKQFYICTECHHIEVTTDEVANQPKHHGQPMKEFRMSK